MYKEFLGFAKSLCLRIESVPYFRYMLVLFLVEILGFILHIIQLYIFEYLYGITMVYWGGYRQSAQYDFQTQKEIHSKDGQHNIIQHNFLHI